MRGRPCDAGVKKNTGDSYTRNLVRPVDQRRMNRSTALPPSPRSTLQQRLCHAAVMIRYTAFLHRPSTSPLRMYASTSVSCLSFIISVRLGNSRFGQLGGWQVSFFRDTIAPKSGFGGGGGYANSAIATSSSAPVFSTASPAGTPRYALFCFLFRLRGCCRMR